MGELTDSHSYDVIGHGYTRRRRADPRIATAIAHALGPGERVLNVGAGTGSYEPPDCRVLAVEPSTLMIAQRPASAAPVIRAVAEALPFASGSFDASMAIMSAHHWQDPEAGLREVGRVTRSRVVLFTWDPGSGDPFWLDEYLPELRGLDCKQSAHVVQLAATLGRLERRSVPIPADCTDGLLGAYWRRPEAYLDPDVQSGISTFQRLDAAIVARGVQRLAADLESGRWDQKHELLRNANTLDLGYVLLIADVR